MRRNYDGLGDMERFRLAVAAWEREDRDELRAIRDTAPTATYRISTYAGMWDGGLHAIWAALTDILNAGLEMALFSFLDSLREDLGQEVDNTDKADRRLLVAKAAQGVMAAWEGLGLFCEELGITREQAIAFGPTVPLLETVISLAEVVLDSQAQCLYWVAERLREDGRPEEADQIWSEWEERTERERTEAARGAADNLLKLWRVEAGLDGD